MQATNFDSNGSSRPNTVLLWVEDPTLLELLSIFIIASGHSLLTACNEEQARKQWMFNSDKVDLLVCDWNAPHVLSSTRFFLDSKPELPLICMVGEACIVNNLPQRSHVLQKPFDQNQFLDCVTELLAGADLHAAAI